MRRSVLAVAAAVSMISVSGGALAQSAAPLSLSADVRAGADTKEASEIRGGFILPTLALIAIGVLIYVLTKNDKPMSP